MKVLLDSDSIFALNNPRDSNHKKSIGIYQLLKKQVVTFYITNLVLYEIATLLSYRSSQQHAIKIIQKLFSGDFNQIFINEELSQKTWQLFFSQKKNRISFTDCANIITIAELKIEKIFSFDKFYQDKLLKV